MTDINSICSKLRQLLAESTDGKWLNGYPNAGILERMPDHVWSSNKELVAKDLLPSDAEFIAYAHNNSPALLDEVERQEKTIGYLRTKILGFYDGTALGELKQRLAAVEHERDVYHKQLMQDEDKLSKARALAERHEKAIEKLSTGLVTAIYDLERIRDADWVAAQMRLGARSGAHVANESREQADRILAGEASVNKTEGV